MTRPRITTFFTSSVPYAKYHTEVRCPGFEKAKLLPPETRTVAVRTFADLYDLGRTEGGRACRLCALEPMLDVVLRPRRGATNVLASFSSQPCPTENLHRYRWGKTTESGEARLLRIAGRLGLDVAHTPTCGPVAYGMLPTEGVRILSANLRTSVHQDASRVPDPLVVTCAWTLLTENPPELPIVREKESAALSAALTSWANSTSLPAAIARRVVAGLDSGRLDPFEVADAAKDVWQLAELVAA